MRLRRPEYYRNYDQSSLDSVYEAMCSNDLSECVVAAIDVLKKSKNFTTFNKTLKSSSESYKHLENGKTLLYLGDYQNALCEYNKALGLAPKHSEVMKVVYQQRALLSLETKQFSSCIKDIDACLAMERSKEIKNKLKTMKTHASGFTWMEHVSRQKKYSPFADHFFEIKEVISSIPSVSSNIKFIPESQQPKVVAARDIPTGSLIALEQAFVSKSPMLHQFVACYYCNKFSFCLMPCDGCCLALFCDKQCKEKSIQEGHNVECEIVDLLYIQDIPCILPVRAVLKMRQMCKSWSELIAASHELGTDRMKNSSLADIFGSDKFSSLNSFKNHHFIYGEMFKNCMYFANVIHYLDTTTSFLPDSPEDKNAAIRAIARLMMHLSLNATPIPTVHATSVATIGATAHNVVNFGYFPFIGKLNHSCFPNTHITGTQRGAALLTIMPIKEGTKLTISYLGHWVNATEEENKRRQEKLFVMNKVHCNCVICNSGHNLEKQLLTKAQLKTFQKWLLDEKVKKFPQEIALVYEKTCQTLHLLSDAPYSQEFSDVFKMFLKCLMIVSIYKFPSVVMSTMNSIFDSVHFIRADGERNILQ